MDGSAAGMGPLTPGGFGGVVPPGASAAPPGQWPDTSTVCAVMASSVAASAICVVPVPPGGTGREPGTKPSGSDQ